MLHLSNILRQEYSAHGITVQCITPGGVSTKLKIVIIDYVISINHDFFQVDSVEFLEPSAAKFAKSALRTVGIVDNTTGYFAHQIMVGRTER